MFSNSLLTVLLKVINTFVAKATPHYMKYYLSLALLAFTQIAKAQVTSFTIDSSKFIKPAMMVLDSIYQDDQAPRYQLQNAVQRKEKQATIDSLRHIISLKDKQNISKVISIIHQYGWLGPQKVGMNASQALFLVIQHADITSQKQYLPMIQAAEKKGEILSSNLAILEDRINMREGKAQYYGSQSFKDKESGQTYIYPIADPDGLERRRKAMGLIPMQEYAKSLHIEWNLEFYKQKLPEIERIAAQRKL